MAQDFIPERDQLMRCPYDESHSIKACRFTRHLIKCGRNHPVKLSVCPFNATHLFPASERLEHIDKCVDKIIVEREIVIPNMDHKKQSGNVEIPYHEASVPTTENWDLECGQHRNTYDPSEAMSKARFRNPSFLSTMTPANKRLFHKQLLDSSRPASSASVKDEEVDDVAKEFKAMRIPRPPLTGASYVNGESDKVSQPSRSLFLPRPRSPSPTPSSSSASSTFIGLGRGRKLFVDAATTKPGGFVFERPQYRSTGRGRGFECGSGSSSTNTSFHVGSDLDLRSNSVVSSLGGSDSDGEFNSGTTSRASTAAASGEDWRLDCSSSEMGDDYSSTQDDYASRDTWYWSSCSDPLPAFDSSPVYSSPPLYDSALLTYIIDGLSTMGLIDNCSSYDSLQIQNIVENLARINLNEEPSSTSSHESYLVQYITEHLARIGIEFIN